MSGYDYNDHRVYHYLKVPVDIVIGDILQFESMGDRFICTPMAACPAGNIVLAKEIGVYSDKWPRCEPVAYPDSDGHSRAEPSDDL